MWQFFTRASGAPAQPEWEQRYGYLGAVGESHYQPALRNIARNLVACAERHSFQNPTTRLT